MILASARSGRLRTSIATLLLALQAVGGGAVALAHASEPQTAPVSVEAHHDASCVVIHDPLRCALCWYAGSLLTPPPTTPAGPQATAVMLQPALPSASVSSTPIFHQAQPRAPPITLS